MAALSGPFGGMAAMLPEGYAASQAVAPLAKFAPQVVGAAFHELMSRLKVEADYITATDGWPRGVSVNASRGRATEKKEWGGTRTLNM